MVKSGVCFSVRRFSWQAKFIIGINPSLLLLAEMHGYPNQEDIEQMIIYIWGLMRQLLNMHRQEYLSFTELKSTPVELQRVTHS